MPEDLRQAITRLQAHLQNLRKDASGRTDRIRQIEKIIEELREDVKNPQRVEALPPK